MSVSFYCKRLQVNNPSLLQIKGPVLIAANHPNSFLDAIILSSVMKQPVYSLARGDAFAGKFFTRLLTSLNMMPVYRISEGAENLEGNYTTFGICQKLFMEGKIVLIFSEGRCINEWHLRPLKKGTARLAMAAWNEGIPLQVLPLGINYSSFRKFGKIVHLNFGTFITNDSLSEGLSFGKAIQDFNRILDTQLQGLVYEIPDGKPELVKQYFGIQPQPVKKFLLLFPAILGFVLHAPLYYPIWFAIRKRAGGHFDSILVGLLFLLYPWYVLLSGLFAYLATGYSISFLLYLLMPLTALALLHIKPMAGQRNYT